MTVKKLKELLDHYPDNAQVVDTYGSIIMWASDRNKNDKVYLEPKSQTDVSEELRALAEKAEEENWDDADVIYELDDMGITLEDCEEYDKEFRTWVEARLDEFGNNIKATNKD